MNKTVRLMIVSNMPRKAEPKESVTVRIDGELLNKLVAIGDEQKFRPTLTALIEDAVREYVKANGSPDKPPAPKSKTK